MRKMLLCVLVMGLVLSGSAGVFALEQEPGWGGDEALEPYAYTIAFVGDTQTVARYHPDQIHVIYDWLLEKKEEMNLLLVAGLGDITDTSEGDEWFAASDAISRLDGNIPYTLVRGNHDDVDSYDAYLNDSDYTGHLNYTYDGILNSYYTFSVGTIDYLILNLDFGPSDKTLQWGCNVLKAYPEHTAIIVTHGYMDADGVLLTPKTSRYAPSRLGGWNDGPAIWDQLVKKFPNISLVVCGHISHPVIAAHKATGDGGNGIWQVLIDPQEVDRLEGPGGYVALFHFSADGKQLQIENYATIPDRRFGSVLKLEVHCTGGNALEGPNAVEMPEETIPRGTPVKTQTQTQPDLTLWIVLLVAAMASCLIFLAVVLLKKPKNNE